MKAQQKTPSLEPSRLLDRPLLACSAFALNRSCFARRLAHLRYLCSPWAGLHSRAGVRALVLIRREPCIDRLPVGVSRQACC